MANNPQKAGDATDEVIAAIQEVIGQNESDQQPQPEQPASATPSTTPPPEGTSAPAPNADLFQEGQRSGGWAPEETGPRRAANDDRTNIGEILQTLNSRRTRLPYIVATIASAVWVIGGDAIAYLYQDQLRAFLSTPGLAIGVIAGLVAALVVPVCFFYVLAHMFRRTQDLRQISQSMAAVAIRLAQPENTARDQIVSVGQAIRREVTAMGDGIERALARAAELETLVHNEISALERAYSDNELRIRELLTELNNQRDILAGQAEQVRNAISSVHLELETDITSVGDVIAEKVNEAASRVTRTLTEKGEHIALALGHAGDSMIDTLSERGSTLLEKLETTSERTTTAIASASERLAASLDYKTENIDREFADLAARVHEMMNARIDQVAQGFAQKSEGVIELMGARSQELTEGITNAGTSISESLAGRAEEANAALRNAGDSLASHLTQHSGDVIAKMEQTSTRVTEAIIAQNNKVPDMFREKLEGLSKDIDARSTAVKDMLAARLQAFEDMFNHGGTELTEKISRDTTSLGNLIVRHITDFDHTVKTYGGELVDRLSRAHPGRFRSDAQLHRHLRSTRQRPHQRAQHLGRPAAVAIRDRAQRPHDRRHQQPDRKRQRCDRRAGQAHRPGQRHH